ncbi:MAG: hypothetical protein QNJ44_17275 [Rhodobacter sp.]|nr:hypothetical protein [Rhodobacter sp.]
MKAVVIREPGGPEVPMIEVRPIPQPKQGWALIHVKSFELNRLEMDTRRHCLHHLPGSGNPALAFTMPGLSAAYFDPERSQAVRDAALMNHERLNAYGLAMVR